MSGSARRPRLRGASGDRRAVGSAGPASTGGEEGNGLVVLFPCYGSGGCGFSIVERSDFARQYAEFGRHSMSVAPESVEAFFDAVNLRGAFLYVASD